MTENLYIFLCFFSAVLADIFTSTFFGLLTPFTLILVFYFTVLKGPLISGVYAVIAGLTIDLLLFRNLLLTPLAFILIVLIVSNIRKKSEIRRHLSLHFIPGIVVGLIYVTIENIIVFHSLSLLLRKPFVILQLGMGTISCILMTGLLLPIFILGLDYIAEFMAFDEYLL